MNDTMAVCIDPQPGIVDLIRESMAQFGRGPRSYSLGWPTKIARSALALIRTIEAPRGLPSTAREGPLLEAAKVLATLLREDLIKMDVESHEEPIFCSITHELQRLKPRVNLVEDQTGAAAPDRALGSIFN